MNLDDYDGLVLPDAADPIIVHLLETQLTQAWTIRQFHDAAEEYARGLPERLIGFKTTIPPMMLATFSATKFYCFRKAVARGPLHHKFRKVVYRELFPVIARIISVLPLSGSGSNPEKWAFDLHHIDGALDELIVMAHEIESDQPDTDPDDDLDDMISAALVPEVIAAPCNTDHVELLFKLVFEEGMEFMAGLDQLQDHMTHAGEDRPGGDSIDNITFLAAAQRVFLFGKFTELSMAAQRFATKIMRDRHARQELFRLIAAWDLEVGPKGSAVFRDGFGVKLKAIAQGVR